MFCLEAIASVEVMFSLTQYFLFNYTLPIMPNSQDISGVSKAYLRHTAGLYPAYQCITLAFLKTVSVSQANLKNISVVFKANLNPIKFGI